MGRGRRRSSATSEIPLSDERDRQLPPRLRGSLRPVPERYDLGALAELKGRFRDGYSDDDVQAVGQALERATGLVLAVVWDDCDNLSCGGSSEECLVEGGVLYRLPEELYALLWESEVPDEDTLEQAVKGMARFGLELDKLVEVDRHNLAVEDRR